MRIFSGGGARCATTGSPDLVQALPQSRRGIQRVLRTRVIRKGLLVFYMALYLPRLCLAANAEDGVIGTDQAPGCCVVLDENTGALRNLISTISVHKLPPHVSGTSARPLPAVFLLPSFPAGSSALSSYYYLIDSPHLCQCLSDPHSSSGRRPGEPMSRCCSSVGVVLCCSPTFRASASAKAALPIGFSAFLAPFGKHRGLRSYHFQSLSVMELVDRAITRR